MTTAENNKTIEIGDREYLIAWVSQNYLSQEIHIYGNPAGLRDLAAKLIAMADLDQSNGGFPDNDSEHHHYSTGCNTEDSMSLPRLTLGRVDTKLDTTKLRDCFPAVIDDTDRTAIH